MGGAAAAAAAAPGVALLLEPWDLSAAVVNCKAAVQAFVSRHAKQEVITELAV
jgi:hypothetical protein